jgi:hypothetical protein
MLPEMLAAAPEQFVQQEAVQVGEGSPLAVGARDGRHGLAGHRAPGCDQGGVTVRWPRS